MVEMGFGSARTVSTAFFFANARADVVSSAPREVGAVPPRVRQVPPVQEGEILWEGVPEYGVERGAPVLVQRERPGG